MIATKKFDTLQECYDHICAHLAKQKRPAMAKGKCVYRTPDGKKACVVGCLVPDNLYDPAMEGRQVSPIPQHTSQAVMKVVEAIRPNDIDQFGWATFLMRAQGLHDNHKYEANEDWLKKALMKLAIDNNLKPGAEQAIKKWTART